MLKIIRIKFKKGDQVKYVSHIEMMNTFMRACRRCDLDVTYTAGFNPGMRMVFALPLPVGLTSQCEYVDIWFNKDYMCEYVVEMLKQSLPKGFEPVNAYYVEKSDLMEDVGSARYGFTVVCSGDLKKALKKLQSMESAFVEKSNNKGPVDIIPMIYKIDVHDGSHFSLLCKAGAKGNLHPRLVLKALNIYAGVEVEEKGIDREELFLKVLQ